MMDCRICDTRIRESFLSLGSFPLSNSYRTKAEMSDMEPHFPLELFVCPKCYLVQLAEFERPENIFSGQYAYFSSYSTSWLEHCRKYADAMVERFGFGRKSFVLEIASNDGYLLQYFKKKKIPVLGIEPASNTAKVAIAKGIPTRTVFFDREEAGRIVKEHGKADLIAANNVIAHNPNPHSFVAGLKKVLKPDGVITLEFPHLLRLMLENQFDTVYHEHFSYFSLHSISLLLERNGLVVFDVEELGTHGGSLRVFARHREDASKPVGKRVARLLAKERKAGLTTLATYRAFQENVKKIKRDLLAFLIKARNKGLTVVGYGAPAKGNTLLQYCGIRTDLLDYTVDLSPHKQGRFLPGTGIPIKNPAEIKKDKPDYVLILPWNLKEEIMQQMAFIRRWKGAFIVPIPRLRVYR